MEKVFISYASAEINEARNICRIVEKNNIKCFIAERDIRPGREYAGEIITGLNEASTMILLMSKSANESPHVLREVEYAVSHHKKVIVYQLEEVILSKSMEYFLMACQWILLGEDQKNRLLGAISETTGEEIKVKSDESQDKASNKVLKFSLGVAILVIVLLLALVIKLLPEGETESPDRALERELPKTVSYEVGDTITLGQYNGEPIDWRLIKINEDGTGVLLAKNILTVKAFDTAEGGEYNEYDGVDYWSYENHVVTDDKLNVLIRGNNEWRLSNIRTWLNSDREMVSYEDQAPTRNASCLHQNFYSEEPGFLYGFSAKEKDALVLTKNVTAPNRLSENLNADGMVESEEYVYLLSVDEIEWIKEANISVYGLATDAARDKDETHNVSDYQDSYQSFWYWTRDPAPETVEKGILVGTLRDDDLFSNTSTVGAACYGIRPAVTVDLSDDIFKESE